MSDPSTTDPGSALLVDPLLLDELPEALLTTEGERVCWANKAAGELLGVPREQVIGRNLGEILAPGERQRLLTIERQHDEGWKGVAMLRARFVRLSDGAEVPVDLRCGCTKGPERRRVLAARGSVEAIRAEELMSRLAWLTSKAGGLLDADSLLDAAGPVFDELGWGVAQIEVRGERARMRRIVASKVGGAIAQYAQSLLGKEVPLQEFALVDWVVKTGKAIFLDNLPDNFSALPPAPAFSETMSRARLTRSVWAPVWVEDRPAGVLVVVGQSVTEHDFVAIQLFAAQVAAALRLEVLRSELVRRERLAAVGEMSAVLAHEVRNPIGVIFNAVSALEKAAHEPPQLSDRETLLGIIREESERLHRLVNDLLDFARPSPPSLSRVALAPLVEAALEAARQDPSYATQRPTVVVEIPPDPPWARADSELIRRALVNMLINAFQNVPAGGRVGVGLDTVGKRVRLRLTNDGQPLPAAVAARIFEPFFTTRPAGTGLGLAVVRRIVESLSGKVELDPTEAGVAFSIWLPEAGAARAG